MPGFFFLGDVRDLRFDGRTFREGRPEAQAGPLGQDRGGSRKRYNRPLASMEASTQCTFRQSGRITQITHLNMIPQIGLISRKVYLFHSSR